MHHHQLSTIYTKFSLIHSFQNWNSKPKWCLICRIFVCAVCCLFSFKDIFKRNKNEKKNINYIVRRASIYSFPLFSLCSLNFFFFSSFLLHLRYKIILLLLNVCTKKEKEEKKKEYTHSVLLLTWRMCRKKTRQKPVFHFCSLFFLMLCVLLLP